jgi:hypothetical protein
MRCSAMRCDKQDEDDDDDEMDMELKSRRGRLVGGWMDRSRDSVRGETREQSYGLVGWRGRGLAGGGEENGRWSVSDERARWRRGRRDGEGRMVQGGTRDRRERNARAMDKE